MIIFVSYSKKTKQNKIKKSLKFRLLVVLYSMILHIIRIANQTKVAHRGFKFEGSLPSIIQKIETWNF